jgi:hypothetical protein
MKKKNKKKVLTFQKICRIIPTSGKWEWNTSFLICWSKASSDTLEFPFASFKRTKSNDSDFVVVSFRVSLVFLTLSSLKTFFRKSQKRGWQKKKSVVWYTYHNQKKESNLTSGWMLRHPSAEKQHKVGWFDYVSQIIGRLK